MRREKIVSPPEGPTHGKGMVPGIRAGGLIFLSAIRGRDPQGKGWSQDTAVQARQALENIKILLEANGGTLDDVVKVTLYLHDLHYRAVFHQVWMEYYPENPPARIAVQVADANASAGGGAHFALDVIALDQSCKKNPKII
jgi:2-iminobutanoate/2-iminopropanoate deaminase